MANLYANGMIYSYSNSRSATVISNIDLNEDTEDDSRS